MASERSAVGSADATDATEASAVKSGERSVAAIASAVDVAAAVATVAAVKSERSELSNRDANASVAVAIGQTEAMVASTAEGRVIGSRCYGCNGSRRSAAIASASEGRFVCCGRIGAKRCGKRTFAHRWFEERSELSNRSEASDASAAVASATIAEAIATQVSKIIP